MTFRFTNPAVPLVVMFGISFLASSLLGKGGLLAQDTSYPALPPKGVVLATNIRQAIEQQLDALSQTLDEQAAKSTDAPQWRPDVEVLIRAVRLAVDQQLFHKESEIRDAATLLNEARRRLQAANSGDRGLFLLGLRRTVIDEPQRLVGGFVSGIDDSVQPYGLVIPANFHASGDKTHRLDVWLHGRGDTKTEIPFLIERMTKVGTYAPQDVIVLHPFGRHCNAFKFAGETDVYEAIAHAQTLFSRSLNHQRIDPHRVSIRGFSMGGAGCWHLAVHNPMQWFAANPGAGFVDTIEYQSWQTKAPYEMTAVRKKLLRWYDVLPWVNNLRNTKVIAYSGELDKQKQAADRVLHAAAEQGFDFPYVIGAKMGHKVDDKSSVAIDRQLKLWEPAADLTPKRKIDFTTFTTKYPGGDWLQITGLSEHWQAGRVVARIDGDQRLTVRTDGVTHLQFDFCRTPWPANPDALQLQIDGTDYDVPDMSDAAGWQCRLVKSGDEWNVDFGPVDTFRKRPGLQGPIDDAFCQRFLFVLPSRPAVHGEVERWIQREQKYAIDRWSTLMRGDVRTIKDVDLTPEHVMQNHLVCFGDFQSNQYLKQLASELPVQWTKDKLLAGGKPFDPAMHAVVFVYPNPQNTDRYVVVNSGMTFRDFSNVSNSRQIAMLGDWAVMNVQAADHNKDIFAGNVVAEGFFDEHWK